MYHYRIHLDTNNMTDNDSEYIYVMDNEGYTDGSMKYGYTRNPHQRILTVQTSNPKPTWYSRIWKIDYVPDHCKNIERHDDVITTTLESRNTPYKNIKKYNGGGGNEFCTGDIDSIKTIMENQNYKLTSMNIEDVPKSNHPDDEIVRDERVIHAIKKRIADVLGLDWEFKASVSKWNVRDYQQEAIQYACDKLHKDKRVYIELATGGGKSYIVYNVLKNLNARTIVIFSPRQIVNAQNVQKIYVDILGNSCQVYDVSNTTQSFQRWYTENNDCIKVIVACIQSHQKVLAFLQDANVTDASIWFDEAHWGLEDWPSADTKDPKWILLNDTTMITYRLFTSASPDRDAVKSQKATFGELYRPIKVCELMRQAWLCSITPFVYTEQKHGADTLSYMLEHFTANKKNWGFSFHHTQTGAASMFLQHLELFDEGKTNVKPFLLVSDTVEKDHPHYASLIRNRNIKNFEATPNSIAYVVAMYSMGYDYKKIDMICFSDYKMSPKDIIQSIGRGTRPDGLGLNGCNLEKTLDVLLPVFADTDELDKYERIAEVLAYLVSEVEIPFDKIVFPQNNKKGILNEGIGNLTYKDSDVVRSKVFELTKYILNRKKKITYKYIRELNKKLGLRSRDDYIQSELIHQCFIKDAQVTFKQDWVSWYDFLGLDTTKIIPTKEAFIVYCKSNGITNCNEYNAHYNRNKNEALPQDPFQMYSNFTNWSHELKEEEELVW